MGDFKVLPPYPLRVHLTEDPQPLGVKGSEMVQKCTLGDERKGEVRLRMRYVVDICEPFCGESNTCG